MPHQRRDWLSVECATTLTAAEHAANDLDLPAAACPMHDAILDDVTDEASAHQARKIGLQASVTALCSRRFRLFADDGCFHLSLILPQIFPLRSSSLSGFVR